MRTRRRSILIFLVTCSCSAPTSLPPSRLVVASGRMAGAHADRRACAVDIAGGGELRSAHASGQLGLSAYWTTDAIWAGAHAILVGRDFDFALAMADGLGAGIAASLRRQGNEAAAKQLEAVDDPQLESSFRRALALDVTACALLEASGPLRLYGVLFGDANARLQVVLELTSRADDTAPSRLTRFVAVSEARPLRGEASWLGGRGGHLRQAVHVGTAALVRSLSQHAAAAAQILALPPEATERCPIGGDEAWKGTALVTSPATAEEAAALALVAPGSDSALVLCPVSAAADEPR